MAPVVDELKAAAAALTQAELPTDLRAPGFLAAFWGAREERGPKKAARTADPKPPSDTGPALRSATVAGRLNISSEEAEEIFGFSDDDVGIVVSPRLLPEGNQQAATDLAYLITAARQALGEGWVDAAPIRAVLADRGKLDGNFNRVLQQMDGDGAQVKGSGRSRRVRLNAVGFERAAEIARTIAATTPQR